MATTNKGIYYPNDYSQVADVPADLKKLAESVDKAIDDIPQYDDSDIKKDIQTIQQEQKTQNTSIQNNTEELELLKNNLPDPVTTEQSEEITVQNAMNYYGSLDVSGNSTQVQTETSPSPNYPSEIKNCGDNINRFDKSTIKTGYYLDSAGAEVANTNYAITDYIEVEENENYTYQGLNITASFGAKGAYYDSSKQFVSSLDLNAEDTIILIPENVKYVKFTIRTTNNNQDTFKIEKGSIATPYSPYNCGSVDIKVENEDEEKIITFPLKEGQLLHAGDYLTSDGVHHVKQTCVFDGTENIIIAYNDETIDSFRIAINSKYNQMLGYQIDDKCSHFKNLGHTPAWGRQANTFALSSEGYLYIFFEKNKITSETEAKNWIAEQYNNGTPLTAEGTLEEEYVESYTEEQQAVYNELKNLILYKGYNYITCIDETKCKMKLTYRPDNNIKIKSLEERIAALESEATV